MNGNYNHRMYAANQIGVATTLPHSTEALHAPNTSSNANSEHGHSAHSNSQDDRFSHRDANIASSEVSLVLLQKKSSYSIHFFYVSLSMFNHVLFLLIFMFKMCICCVLNNIAQ